LLRTALNDFDSVAIKKITNELHNATLPTAVAPVIEDILRNVLIGDDDKTVALIDSLL